MMMRAKDEAVCGTRGGETSGVGLHLRGDKQTASNVAQAWLIFWKVSIHQSLTAAI